MALYHGGTAVLPPKNKRPGDILSLIERHRPTVFFAVPTVYRMILGHRDSKPLDSLRLCVSAGEKLSVKIFEEWRSRYGFEIVDGIGTTEVLSTFITNRPGDIRPGSTGKLVGGFDVRLMLSNLEWRREINLGWIEFSRWGIQQIILIARLYFIKNPIIQRGINIASAYVFARGVEVSCDDERANDQLTSFFQANSKVFGKVGLWELEKRLYYDGQIFFAFFSDTQSSGETKVRTIDATEIQEILTNPDDSDEVWYFRRLWTQRVMDETTGGPRTQTQECWYPALGYTKDDPPGKRPLEQIQSKPINWDSSLLQMKGGVGISKWLFDVPRVFAALDWAKAARKFLEACLTTQMSHATIAWELSTKGGQQAIEGQKQQLQTTVSAQPGVPGIWDTNPTPTNAAIAAYGPGTKLSVMNSRGAGGDPKEVREYLNMVAQVIGIPPTFLGELETANLATATTLDRPTEIGFEQKQEMWHDTLLIIALHVLGVNAKAPSGKLREALKLRKITIMEAERRADKRGRLVYIKEAADPAKLKVKVSFPAIREGDMPANVKAIVEAMTLDNKGGQITGIDEKTGVSLLFQQLGVEDPEEILELMFPEGEYDPDRTKEILPEPIHKARPDPGGEPQLPGGKDPPVPTKTQEAITRLIEAGRKLKRRVA